MKKGSLKYGGAITIDGVHLKVQGKLFNDFTLHYMEITNKEPFDSALFNMKNMTLLLVNGLATPSVQYIKNCLNAALLDKYELSMDHFFPGFTIFTDGAAVMANVANASVSRGIHTLYETWMSCLDYYLNRILKSVLSSHCHSPSIEVVAKYFWSIKRIIGDGNRSGWSHLLPNGYKLLQDGETRFEAHYQVSERFLKTAHYIDKSVDYNLNNQAQVA